LTSFNKDTYIVQPVDITWLPRY